MVTDLLTQELFVVIPLITSSFSAGNGNPMEDNVGAVEIPISAVKNIKNPYSLNVTGFSMSPTIENKDIVIVELDGRCKNGDIIALQVNGELLIKEFRETFKGLELVSHNKAFAVVNISDDDIITIFGVVKKIIRNLN